MHRIRQMVESGIPFEFDGTQIRAASPFPNHKDLETEVPADYVQDDQGTLQVTVKGEAAETLMRLISYIGRIGNQGHGFDIVVDPDNSDYTKKFGWDGDGSDFLGEMKYLNSDGKFVNVGPHGQLKWQYHNKK